MIAPAHKSLPRLSPGPVEIGGMQFEATKEGIAAVMEFLGSTNVGILGDEGRGWYLRINTVDGFRYCHSGDWIIKSVTVVEAKDLKEEGWQ